MLSDSSLKFNFTHITYSNRTPAVCFLIHVQWCMLTDRQSSIPVLLHLQSSFPVVMRSQSTMGSFMYSPISTCKHRSISLRVVSWSDYSHNGKSCCGTHTLYWLFVVYVRINVAPYVDCISGTVYGKVWKLDDGFMLLFGAIDDMLVQYL